MLPLEEVFLLCTQRIKDVSTITTIFSGVLVSTPSCDEKSIRHYDWIVGKQENVLNVQKTSNTLHSVTGHTCGERHVHFSQTLLGGIEGQITLWRSFTL